MNNTKQTLPRNIATLLFIISFGLVSGQGFSYPEIKSNGSSLADFVPNGWVVLDSVAGDLNNDKLKDIAFVLQHRDSVAIFRHEENMNNDTVITRPRILVIVFYNAATKRYDLVEQSNTFILDNDNPNMDEPFESISILKGVLKIDFHIFMNAGSWYMSNNYYKFRYQDKEFKLIGADYNSVNRGSGATEDRSYNFLTKKVKVAIGTISSSKQKTTWRTFELKELKTFRTFVRPFSWEVEKDFII